MISLAEIVRAMVGGWRILRFDVVAVDLFGRTGAAAWRSFAAYLVVIPLMLLSNWPPPEKVFTTFGLTPLTYLLLAVLQFVITILSFYLLVAVLTARLGVGQRLAHYVSAQNWLSLPVWVVMAPLYMIMDAQGVGDQGGAWMQIIIHAVLLTYSWAITVGTLRLRHLPAFALCVLELLFGQFVQQIFAFILVLTLAPG